MSFTKYGRGKVTEVGTISTDKKGKVVLSAVKKVGGDEKDLERKDVTVGRRKKAEPRT